MAQEGPNVADIIAQQDPDAPWFRFPPFPSTKDKEVISFNDFKPKGVQITDDDQVEVDGEGVPTVMLKVIHDLDKAKSKKRKRKGADPSDPNAPRMTWWEEWEELDSIKTIPALDP